MSNALNRRTTPLQNRLIALIQFLFFLMGLLLMLGGGARISIEFGRELFGINTGRFKEGLANWTGDTFTSLPVLAIAILVFGVGYNLWWSAAALGAKTPPAWHAGRNGMLASLAALAGLTGLAVWMNRFLFYVLPTTILLGALIAVVLVRFSQPDFRLNLGAERIQRTEPRRSWLLYGVLAVAISTLTVLGLVYAVLTDAIELPLPDVGDGELLYLTTFDDYNDEWDLAAQGKYRSEVLNDEQGNPQLVLTMELDPSDAGDGFYSLLNRKFRDFDLRVTTTQLESDAVYDNRFGIIFRYRDDKNYYSFEISGDGNYRLIKAAKDDEAPNGVRVDVISEWHLTTDIRNADGPPFNTLIRPGMENPIAQPLDAMNELRIVARGSRFWFYVNGEPLLFCLKGSRRVSMWAGAKACVEGNIPTYVFNDADYKQGKLGFFVGTTVNSDPEADVRIAFDNVVILGPPSTIVVPSLDPTPTP